MLHVRDADAGRVRLASAALAVLTFGALLCASVLFAHPVFAATGAPPITVGLTPESARPGEEVVVSFSTPDPWVSFTSCRANLEGEGFSDCRESGGQWSVHFTVPTDASPGASQVSWELDYQIQDRSLLLDPNLAIRGDTKGTLSLTVLPPEPSFTVEVSPPSARPGQRVNVSFTPTDANNSITSCQVKLDDATYDECTATNGRGSVRFQVPTGTAPGARTLRWQLGYQYPDPDGLGSAETKGTVHFTVLAPQPPPPTFSASLRPGSAHPGDAISVLLAALDPGVSVTGCSAQLRNDTFHGCHHVKEHWALDLGVPSDAQPGRTSVIWHLSYRDVRPGARTPGREHGSLAVTVLPARSGAPTFSVALRPESADPGGVVTLVFSPRDPGTAITGCTALFAGETFRDCRRSGDTWELRLTVPDGAERGRGLVHWTLSYATGTSAGGGSEGDLPLTVLDPPLGPDRPVGASLSTGLRMVPLALLVLAVFTLAVLRGSRGRAPKDRANPVPSSQTVRATAHAEVLPGLTIKERGPMRSRVIRFVAQRPLAVVKVKEVSR